MTTASSRDSAPPPHQSPPAAATPAPSAPLSAPRVPRRSPPQPPACRFTVENGGRRRAHTPMAATAADPLLAAPAPPAGAGSVQHLKPPATSPSGLPSLLPAIADLAPASRCICRLRRARSPCLALRSRMGSSPRRRRRRALSPEMRCLSLLSWWVLNRPCIRLHPSPAAAETLSRN